MTIPEILLSIALVASVSVDLLLKSAVRRLKRELAHRDRTLARLRSEVRRLRNEAEGNGRTMVVNITADTSKFDAAIARVRAKLGGLA